VEGELQLHAFLTLALTEGQWVVGFMLNRFILRKESLIPIRLERGWAPEPIWTRCLREEPLLVIESRSSARSMSLCWLDLLNRPFNLKYWVLILVCGCITWK
jgi:hypothetical protein